MSEEVQVRAAGLENLEQIVEFNAAIARETENLELDRERLSEGVRAVFENPARGRYFLATRGGKVLGQAMITTEWSDWRNGDVWWLQSVYVAPPERRRGVFSHLFQAIEQQARASGARGLRLYVDKLNKRAQQIYQRLGMQASHYKMMEVDFVITREERGDATEG